MKNTVLITGGAGFIGSFLTDYLLEKGHSVRILDNLEPQVHHGKKPRYLNKHAEFIQADTRDRESLKRALKGMRWVIHLAARVGVSQANYQVKEYMDVNVGGMATLLDVVANEKKSVEKIAMAASMTSYGEGMYRCMRHGRKKMHIRSADVLRKKQWNLVCPQCRSRMKPVPTNEDTIFENKGIYALSKEIQEQMLFSIGTMYQIPSVSLRLFNVYGPRQSLSNPYTGVSAIFISRLRNGVRPVVFEDGLQSRDFVSVHDVCEAMYLSLTSSRADFMPVNIGSGDPTGIAELATTLASLLGVDLPPDITFEGRKGDIRHCFADITRAKKLLGWYPKITLERGLKELIEWSAGEQPHDRFDDAIKELAVKKLLVND